MTFLSDHDLRPLELADARAFRAVGLALGKGAQPVEVAIIEASHRPSLSDLRTLWKARLKGRATPLLMVALYDGRAAICGPTGEQPPAYADLDPELVERICRAALGEPDRHAALRRLHAVIPNVRAPLAGLRNEGLFAGHQLERVREGLDWVKAASSGRAVIGERGEALLRALGFSVEPLAAGPGAVLRSAGTRTALAIFLDRNESAEIPTRRFSDHSPITWALNVADREQLRYVIVCAGSQVRIYMAEPGRGVGQRARTETYLEIDLDFVRADDAGYLWLLFSADALGESGSFERILEASHRFGAELGERLRERVYWEVVPGLSKALLAARGLAHPDAEQLRETYQMAVLMLFRLLFVAYAEDRDLLPYHTNGEYQARSLKQKASDLAERARSRGVVAVEQGEAFDRESSSLWEEVKQLFNAINQGHSEWGVPAYNGGLFLNEKETSPLGHTLAQIKLNNRDFGPVLFHLLVDRTPEGLLPVDFRSLSVREFGTIYEGLLENELSVARADLAVTPKGEYRLARNKDEIEVHAGQLYPHTPSGARKSTGSYFTKHFAVEHLLDHALEPALDDHLKRLDALDDRAAAEAFFDFRVADIAMGSGHFLVATVDRIERKLSNYLTARPLADVSAELVRLLGTAKAELEKVGLADGVEIEGTQLLRRQIARRCICGVDLNGMAVELARLSIWIHTFVPGLPLSFLDHNLVEGNSLVGIATIAEAEATIKEMAGALYALSTEEMIGKARDALAKLGRVSDANAAEIAAARRAAKEALEAVAPAEALFDILAAARIDEDVRGVVNREASHWKSRLESLPSSSVRKKAREVLKAIPPLHFPIAFPEVFLRERAGFDVILGNPPWEEATVEEDRFWTRYDPGFHSLPQGQQESVKKRYRRDRPDLVRLYEEERQKAELLRSVLVAGPFPGMGTGDPDVYKAFAWRFWNLVTERGGRIGVVLPRSAFAAKGSSEFRQSILGNAEQVTITQLLNNRSWVFDDVHPQYTITLTCIEKGAAEGAGALHLSGPFADLRRYQEGRNRTLSFPIREVVSWTDTAALPLLPDDESGEIFAQLRKAPRLDLDDPKSWRARPYAELHATHDKPLMRLTEKQPDGFWPVFKGESFDIWINDTGTYYGWSDPDKVIPVLQNKRQRSAKQARSPFSGFPPTWFRDLKTLSCWSARIAFRDVSRATDSRTVRATLLPPKIFVTNKAPYFLWPSGDEMDQAFLLGALCSIPLDWYARRFVEVSLNYHVLNPLPVPRPSRDNPLWQRAVALAGRLACADKRYRKWAEAVGVEYGPLPDHEKEDMIHELDAVVAHLYGLTESQLTHIFETFHEGWDCAPRLQATLKHFRNWEKRNQRNRV
jgi:Eco57I restriction-modification methylase